MLRFGSAAHSHSKRTETSLPICLFQSFKERASVPVGLTLWPEDLLFFLPFASPVSLRECKGKSFILTGKQKVKIYFSDPL